MNYNLVEYILQIQPIGKKLSVKENTPLFSILPEFGVEFPCGGKGKCKKCEVTLLEGNLATQAKDDYYSVRQTYLACQTAISGNATIEIAQFDSIVLSNEDIFHFEPKTGSGIAIDVGSTTIVAQLLDLETGKVLQTHFGQNPQKVYGADIISRLEYALTPENYQNISDCLRNYIFQLIDELISTSNKPVVTVKLAGNTAMHHLFNKLDIRPLTFYPFLSENTGIQSLLHPKQSIELVFQPCIGGFVGSDILMGILATGIFNSEKWKILVDLGTNGEIVLGRKGRILCASTAAGPAFEGTCISFGMSANKGAISSVERKNNEFVCNIIGNAEPKGICGSGLIDCIAEALRNELIDESGYIKEGNEIQIINNIVLTQKDIREFQLAKAAIAAGIQILLNQEQICSYEIESIYLAGAFGTFLNIQNVLYTGLLEFESKKIKTKGNTSLLGTKMSLFYDNKYINEILAQCNFISLETSSSFQDIFAEKIFFNFE